MDENNVVIKYLQDNGYEPRTSYYSKIDLWNAWYKNFVKEFHEYHDHNGKKRRIHRLGMAKRICEDWSSILYTEKDDIVCKNKNNQAYIDETLKKIKFNDNLADNIETAFWSGTVGTIIRIKDVNIVNKKIVKTDKTHFELVNVNASQIIPLRIEDGKIVDVAFVSETIIQSDKAYYIEIHELKENGYVIKNVYIDEKGNLLNIENIPKEYEIGSDRPIFNLFSPRIVNNIEDNNGLGISVYANALDQLETCDTVYNNFYMDFYLGGKKVFYNKKLTKYETIVYKDDETGETVTEEVPIYPDDITKQQFQVIGDEFDNVNENSIIHEFNPDLREQDNEAGLNFALNMLSFKCGLGKDYYRFENGQVMTATQALINNRDLTGNAKKHRSAVNDYSIGIVKSLLLLARILLGENVTEEDEIELTDKDGFLISEEDLKEQYLNEIASGLRQPYEYRMKFFGEDEKTAKKMTSFSDNFKKEVEDEEM